MPTPFRRALSAVAATTVVGGLLLTGAATASAHVRVTPDTTAAGGYAHLTFNVPTESDTASTSVVAVDLPKDKPFTSVAVRPIEGWTAKLTTTTLPKPVEVDGATVTKAVTTVTWTADAAHRIAPHQYQSFDLSVGKLPDSGTTVVLPATQTYTDGQVVRWNEPMQGDTEPEHPAPAFTTTAEGADTHAGSAHDAQAASASEPAQSQDSATGVWGIVLGAIGLVLGAAALLVALRNRPRASA